MCCDLDTNIGRYSEKNAKTARIEPSDVGVRSWDDVEGVKAWQAARGLEPDGMFGRASILAFYRQREDGFRLALAAAGVKLDTTKYHATRSYPREVPILPLSVIWHDTVDRTAAQAFAALEAQHYATGFIVDEDGTVYQCVDVLNRWTVHAGAINQESIGVDMVNVLDPGYLGHAAGDEERRARVVHRPWSASKSGNAIDYTPAQKRSALALASALSDWLRIPKTIPRQLPGYGYCLPDMTENSTGHFAHAQWSKKRWDGLFIAEELAAAGYEEWHYADH